MNVVLPVVIGLNVLGAIVFLCVRRASWRFQSWVFLGLLVAFALLLGGPLYPKREVTREVQVVHVANVKGAEPEVTAVSRSESASWMKLLPFVGGIWILGLLVSLWRLRRSQWALRKLVGKSEPLADGPLEAAFGKRFRLLLEEGRISVLQTDVDVSPCCFGWLQRRVVFPSEMLGRLNREERDLVLRHEILHLTSGDVLLLYFQRLMEALYWWNPVVAKISGSLSQAREGLCDEALVESGAESQTYASVLIQLGELSSQRLSSAVSGSPVYRCLKLRLERIMNGRPPSRKLAWCGGAVALGVCASAVFAVVQVGHVVPEPKLSAAKERPLQLSDFPTLELFGYFDSGGVLSSRRATP